MHANTWQQNNCGPNLIHTKCTETIVDSKITTTPFRHFEILPVLDDNENDSDGELLTLRFVSSVKFNFGINTIPFIEQQNKLSQNLKLLHPHGIILQSKEKSAKYPIIQLTFGNDILFTKNENWLTEGFECRSCLYKKLKQIDEIGPDIGYKQNIYYIILGFKTSDAKFNQALISSWKDWTGARFIYINFPSILDLKEISLYHKQIANNVDLFSYIVIVKCNGLDTKEKLITLLDFVQRLRAEKTSNFISLYCEALT